MEPDVWLKDCREYYEFISVHIDDVLIASKYPQVSVDSLMNNHNFKLKRAGPISHRLGCDFGRDVNETLHFTTRKHVEKMI